MTGFHHASLALSSYLKARLAHTSGLHAVTTATCGQKIGSAGALGTCAKLSKGMRAQERGSLKHSTTSPLRHVSCRYRLSALRSALRSQSADKLMVKEAGLTCRGIHHRKLFMDRAYGHMGLCAFQKPCRNDYAGITVGMEQ